jgi:glutathione S-transferase
MPPMRLHRCSWTFLHTDMDACWKVQRALDEKGIDYEVVKHGFRRGKAMRAEMEKLSGQRLLPVLELPDGSVYRAESDDMAAAIRSGEIADRRANVNPAG